MGITLSIEISGPLTDEDNDLLQGVAAMAFAVANARVGLIKPPEQESVDPDYDDDRPCGARSDADPPTFCVKELGHAGRHKYRPLDLHFEEWAN